MQSKTAWQSVRLPRFAPLDQDAECDVLVVGGGITGLTAAYLLREAGQRVMLVERDRLASGDTGCTTAHLTFVTDARISELVKGVGRERAQLAWYGGAAAIDEIERIVAAEAISCQFQRAEGRLHAAWEGHEDESASLQADARTAKELGFAADFIDEVPGVGKPGVIFAKQALFHPLRYLAAVAAAVDGGLGSVHERSEVTEFAESPRCATVNGHRVKCRYIVLATHVPLVGEGGLLGATLFQTKLASYSTYAVGAKLPTGAFPLGSFWDTAGPYYYLRVDRRRGHDYAILGGKDHKTGQDDDPQHRFQQLGELLQRIIPGAVPERQWSGQVVETHDGLPYMGETAPGQFAATGFSGNGMTFGTLAGMMACDAALERKNPWQELFDPARKPVPAGIWDYVKENVDYPYYLLRDRIKGAEGNSEIAVKPGEGKLLKIDGQHVACSCDDEGKRTMVSAICTHMGCLVHWNGAEKTWDCPCHGSRFKTTGEVIAGPAETPLAPFEKRAEANGQSEKPARPHSVAAESSR